MSFKLIIPGEAPVKKNAFEKSYTRKNKKTGIYEPLKFPIGYYTQEYNDWAWKAIQYLRAWKEQKVKENWSFPLTEQYVVTLHFFRKTSYKSEHTSSSKGKIDISNLYDSVLDIMAGQSGLKIPKYLNMEHEDYKIIEDDSFAYVKNHGGTHIFYDPLLPRTVVYVSKFKIKMLNQIMEVCHEGLELLTSMEEVHREANSFKFIEKQTRKKSEKIDFDIDLDSLFKKE